jgi:hypothetical protein
VGKINRLDVTYSRLFGWLPSGALDSDWFSSDGKTWDETADWKSNHEFLSTHEAYSQLIFDSMHEALQDPITQIKDLPAELVIFLERVVSRDSRNREDYPEFYLDDSSGPLETWYAQNKLPKREIESALNFYNYGFGKPRQVPLSAILNVANECSGLYGYLENADDFQNAILFEVHGFLSFATHALSANAIQEEGHDDLLEIRPRFRRHLNVGHPFSPFEKSDRLLASWFGNGKDLVDRLDAEQQALELLSKVREIPDFEVLDSIDSKFDGLIEAGRIREAHLYAPLRHYFKMSKMHSSELGKRNSSILDIWVLVSPLTGSVHELICWLPLGVSLRRAGDWEMTSKEEIYDKDFSSYCVFQIDWETDPLTITDDFDFDDPRNNHRIIKLWDNGQLKLDQVLQDCQEVICSNDYGTVDGIELHD